MGMRCGENERKKERRKERKTEKTYGVGSYKIILLEPALNQSPPEFLLDFTGNPFSTRSSSLYLIDNNR